MTIRALSAALLFAFTPMSAAADQAECERTVRALLTPFDQDPSAGMVNRFGTVTSTIDGVERVGYSFQSAEGSIYYDQDKNPVSMLYTSGESYWSVDGGKTWNLGSKVAQADIDAANAAKRLRAEKATNILCEYGVEFEGRTVNHYSVDHVTDQTGDKVHTEYWVDPETGFVWRDLNHLRGAVVVISDVRAEPAPDMEMPEKPL